MSKLLKPQSSFRRIWRRRRLIAGFILAIAVYLWATGFMLWAGLLGFLTLPFFKRNKILVAGAKGENAVSKLLLKELDNSWYLINDCIVNKAQIDHILIGPKGIFVIETKNYKGIVYGNREDKKWTKTRNSRFKTFYNPIKQSKTHSFKVADLLREGHYDYFAFALVVFAGQPLELNITVGDFPVLRIDQLKDYILSQPDKMLKVRAKEVAGYLIKRIRS
ncbi:hypothetical protein AUJ26_00060 [Candidatus Falkowbacteria bacterium CG1_02_37_21]|nr:MAG: hypothetical protein AUJ26_00060 [Candidatus Falkowbacteria bacterium CG1_02_37_21]